MPSIWRCEILRCSCSNLDTERTQRWLKQSDSSVSQQNLWKPCSMVSSQTALNLARQRLLAHTVWKAVDRNLHSVNLTNLLVLHIKTNSMEEKMFAIEHNNLVSLKLKQILTFVENYFASLWKSCMVSLWTTHPDELMNSFQLPVNFVFLVSIQGKT